MAKDLEAQVRLGEDPVAERVQALRLVGDTFGGAKLTEFLEAKESGIGAEKKLTPRWLGQVTGLLQNYARPLHARPISAIDRAEVSDLIATVAKAHGAGQANRFRAVLSSYFAWLIGEGRIDSNPVVGTNKPTQEVQRERVLSDAELHKIWRHADGEFGTIVKLLILTGARRTEIGDLRWSEIDFNERLITLPPSRTKNKREFEIPMAPAVMQILKALPRREDRDLVFGLGDGGYAGWSKSKDELDSRLRDASVPLSDWVLHDFRRSFSTVLHDKLKVEPHIVEALLNHVSGHKSGVAGTYNKATYREPKRKALAKWAKHIEGLMNGKRAGRRVTSH
jgi:integrase